MDDLAFRNTCMIWLIRDYNKFQRSYKHYISIYIRCVLSKTKAIDLPSLYNNNNSIFTYFFIYVWLLFVDNMIILEM